MPCYALASGKGEAARSDGIALFLVLALPLAPGGPPLMNLLRTALWRVAPLDRTRAKPILGSLLSSCIVPPRRRPVRPRILLLALPILLLGTAPVRAEIAPRIGLEQIFVALQSGPTVPPEWAGVWETKDSTFFCAGMFLGESTGNRDTLCAGIPISEEDPAGQIQFTCSGTATADEVHVTCSGSADVSPDCQETQTIDIDGVRTGDTYALTIVNNTVTQGTGLGCGSAFCIETRSTGARIEPEPTAYCATQNETTTWGRMKVLYR